jgi:phosphoenolpyruvate synthase/pyruvate phosphate dikinase
LHKNTHNYTLKEGVKLFGDNKNFNKYAEDFENYKKRSSEFFEKIKSKNKLTKEEVQTLLDLIAEHWKYYQKTEFFYVDEAYTQSKNNLELNKNLKKLEKIKMTGREHLNKLIFGESSHLSKSLSTISKQFDVTLDELFWSSKDEILRLFDGNKIDKSLIDNRQKFYIFTSKDGDITSLEGDDAKRFISEFLIETKTTSEWKGTIANPGKVKGKVKKIIGGSDSYDKLHQLIDEMNQGDILVADTTSPELIMACQKASAILTNQGGLLSHAAIVSRELNIPCIVGLGNITHMLKDGDYIEVDATLGIVRILK